MKIPDDFHLAFYVPWIILLIVLGIGIFLKNSVIIGSVLPVMLLIWIGKKW